MNSTQRKAKKDKIDDVLKKIENTLDIDQDGKVKCSEVFDKIIRARQQIQNLLRSF